MQSLTVVRLGATLALGMVFLCGCEKKEEPRKTEAPATAPAPQPALPEQARTGEALFKQHCAVCHPEGSNIVKPELTLYRKALATHNVTKPEDIVRIMRNPGPGMNRFDEATIPDKDAMAIARHVLDTFK